MENLVEVVADRPRVIGATVVRSAFQESADPLPER
jgi:hypothetical protein